MVYDDGVSSGSGHRVSEALTHCFHPPVCHHPPVPAAQRCAALRAPLPCAHRFPPHTASLPCPPPSVLPFPSLPAGTALLVSWVLAAPGIPVMVRHWLYTLASATVLTAGKHRARTVL